MGLLDRLGVRAHADQSAAIRPQEGAEEQIVVRLVEDTHTFEGHDGETIWCGGLSPIAEDRHFLSEAEHLTSDPRAFFCKVAGARHYPGVLDDPRIGPGSPVVVKAEPENPYDENAVAIWGLVDGDHVGQLGHVPATLCPEIATILKTGTQMGGQVLREFRLGSSRGKRIGFHVLIAPAGPVSLVIEDDD
jgi:hypothetical protein